MSDWLEKIASESAAPESIESVDADHWAALVTAAADAIECGIVVGLSEWANMPSIQRQAWIVAVRLVDAGRALIEESRPDALVEKTRVLFERNELSREIDHQRRMIDARLRARQ